MPLPRNIFVPAFRQQKLGVFFALIVGIMVYVATFAMAAQATLSAVTFTWDKGMENRMTVEIPARGDESAMPQEDRIQQIMAILKAVTEIEKVTQIPESKTAELLRPWIKDKELLEALPLPTLIDIERKEGSTISAKDVEKKLQNTIHDVHVDDHALWLEDIAHLVSGLGLMALLMIVLTASTLIIAVNLVCRAIMATERETLQLLHIMGAEDRDIAGHFEWHARQLSLPASFSGFFLALLSAGILLFFLRHFADPASLAPLHWVGLGFLVLLVPLVAVFMAALTARRSAFHCLYQMP